MEDLESAGNMKAMKERLAALLKEEKKRPEDFINSVISPYRGEPEVYQEAVYLAAKAMLENRHVYTAYQILQLRIKQWDAPRAAEIAKLLTGILSDEKKACNALQLNLNGREGTDGLRLSAERCSILLECIPALATEREGYYGWRAFLKCQSDNAWHRQFHAKLENILPSYSSVDWKRMVDSSVLFRWDTLPVQEASPSIKVVQLLRSPEFNEKLPYEGQVNSDELMKRIGIIAVTEASTEERLWIYY